MPYCDTIMGKKLEVIVINYECLQSLRDFCEYNKGDIIKNRLGNIVYSDSYINLDINNSTKLLNKVLFRNMNISILQSQERDIFTLKPSLEADGMNLLYSPFNDCVVPYNERWKLVCSIKK